MARGKPLIPLTTVADYEVTLRKAVLAALDGQVASINRKLRSHGLPGSLTAAGTKKKAAGAAAVGAIVVPLAWSADTWAKQVNEHLAPAAASVASAAVADASANVAASAVWGMATAEQTITDTIVAQALASGAAIGARVDAAGIAAEDVAEGITTAMASSADILGGVIGALSNMAATVASDTVAQAVTAYGAPEYLSATKTWNSMEDDKVRPDHEDADGQEVSINVTFQVGAEDMTGPGDPSASDEQTINCRCYVSYDGLVPEGAGDFSPEAGGDTIDY